MVLVVVLVVLEVILEQVKVLASHCCYRCKKNLQHHKITTRITKTKAETVTRATAGYEKLRKANKNTISKNEFNCLPLNFYCFSLVVLSFFPGQS